jgi:hypothetical protein
MFRRARLSRRSMALPRITNLSKLPIVDRDQIAGIISRQTEQLWLAPSFVGARPGFPVRKRCADAGDHRFVRAKPVLSGDRKGALKGLKVYQWNVPSES